MEAGAEGFAVFRRKRCWANRTHEATIVMVKLHNGMLPVAPARPEAINLKVYKGCK